MSHINDVVLALLLLLLFLVPFAAAQAGGDLVPPPPSDFNFGPVFNPTMAIVMIVLVSAFFSLGFFSVYVRHCSARRSRGGASDADLLFGGDRRRSWRSGRRGIGEEVIRTFPTFPYSAVKRLKIGKGALECAVCLNEFEDDETLRLMPKCSHVFHADCVDAWLSSHDTCPVCRANLVPKPGEDLAVQMPDPDPTDQNRPARTRSTAMRFGGLFPFPRSHSTGHSLVQPGENRERFTLRLPEDIMMNLNRARSVSVLPRARSERKGFRSASGSSSFPYERFDQETRPDRWSLSMVPPFVLRTGSVRSTRSAEQKSLMPSSDRLQPNIEV